MPVDGAGGFEEDRSTLPPHPASKVIKTKAKQANRRVEIQFRRRIETPGDVLIVLWSSIFFLSCWLPWGDEAIEICSSASLASEVKKLLHK